MSTEKSVSVSYRVTPEFKELLEVAAARAQRSQTNLLEWLLFEHCRHTGLLPRTHATKQHATRGKR